MTPEDLLARTGGVASARLLVRGCGQAAVRAALESGGLVRSGRGRYALPHTEAALATAHGLTGVLSHLSAARWWGWEVKTQPVQAWVTVPHDRKRRATSAARLSFRDLPAADVVPPGVTAPLRTVLDCATVLPFDEALAVADSALRHRAVRKADAVRAADASPARGRARRRRVARLADGRADNPFESVLRAIALDAGLSVEPQVPIHIGTAWCRPDLLDDSRALAIEAESFTWHGERGQLTWDCQKYNGLTGLGLRVLRFAWEQVILNPDYTRAVLMSAATGIGGWNGPISTHPGSNAGR
ncbi:MAG: hypothetical protein ACJ786_12645 [Catenulispora sp.]